MSAVVTVRAALSTRTAHQIPDPLFAARVRDAALAQLQALGMPARIEVESGGSFTPRPGDPPFAIDIDGEPARLDRVFASEDPEEWISRLDHDFMRNASLFVTPAVVEELRARWSDMAPRPPVAELPLDRLIELVGECVRAGCSLDRLAQVEAAGDERDPPEWRLLEGALESSIRLHVGVPVGFLGMESPQEVSDALQDRAHAALGVSLPLVRITELEPEPGNGDSIRLDVLDLSYRAPIDPAAGPPAEALFSAMRPWLPSFLTRETVLHALTTAAGAFPLLTSAVRERYGDVFLTRTFRALVEEGIGIHDLRTVLGGLLEIREPTAMDETRFIVFHSPAGTPPPLSSLPDGRLDPDAAADCVRRWARRQVTSAHWQAGMIRVRLLDAELEEAFRLDGVRPGSGIQRRFLEELNGSADPILTNADVRRRVRRSLEKERPDVPVLCYQELLPESTITPVDRISL